MSARTGPGRRRAPGPGASRHTTGALGLLGLLVATVVTACGVPTDHTPRVLNQAALPAALAPQTTTTMGARSPGVQEVRLYLVRNEASNPRLVPVPTAVPASSDQLGEVRATMTQLVSEQPASSGATRGLTNTIPSSVRIIGLKMDGDVLDLDVSNLDNVESTQQRLAFAQMVYTATDLPGVDAVRFWIDHRTAQVPLDTTASKPGQAIDRDAYAELSPAG